MKFSFEINKQDFILLTYTLIHQVGELKNVKDQVKLISCDEYKDVDKDEKTLNTGLIVL